MRYRSSIHIRLRCYGEVITNVAGLIMRYSWGFAFRPCPLSMFSAYRGGIAGLPEDKSSPKLLDDCSSCQPLIHGAGSASPLTADGIAWPSGGARPAAGRARLPLGLMRLAAPWGLLSGREYRQGPSPDRYRGFKTLGNARRCPTTRRLDCMAMLRPSESLYEQPDAPAASADQHRTRTWYTIRCDCHQGR